ncbi:hypothetical protein SK128_005419, partial [Halocaridina rubra]
GLVPGCPKNHAMPSLEVLQHTINYIGDLQESLSDSSDSETPPISPTELMSFSDGFNGYGEQPCQTRYEQRDSYPSTSYRGSVYRNDHFDGFGSSYTQNTTQDDYNRPLILDDYNKPLNDSYNSSNYSRGYSDYRNDYRSGYNNDFSTS